MTAASATPGNTPANARIVALEGVLIGVLALLAYAVLGQRTHYEYDGIEALAANARAALHGRAHGEHPYYTFFPWLLATAIDSARSLGGSRYDGGLWLSAVGSAVGAAMFHLAGAWLGLAPTARRIAGAVVALTPGIVFFATVVEVHGSFLPFAALALLTMVAQVRSPSASWVALSAAALFLAYLAHPSGALMGCLFPALWWIGRAVGTVDDARSFRRALLGFAVVGVVLGAVVFVFPRLEVTPRADGLEAIGQAVGGWSGEHETGLLRSLEIAWSEILLPFAPASFLAILLAFGARERAIRCAALWCLASALVYAFVCWLILPNYSEHGAYALPLGVPLALLAAVAIGRRVLLGIALVLGAAAVSLVEVRGHDDPEPARAFYAGAVATAEPLPLQLIVGTPFELGAYQIHGREGRDLCVYLFELFAIPEDQVVAQFDAYFGAHLDRVCLLVSRETLTVLRETARTGAFPRIPERGIENPGIANADELLDCLESRYRLEPVQAEGFDGFRVRRRE
jgi:hypothetical protein